MGERRRLRGQDLSVLCCGAPPARGEFRPGTWGCAGGRYRSLPLTPGKHLKRLRRRILGGFAAPLSLTVYYLRCRHSRVEGQSAHLISNLAGWSQDLRAGGATHRLPGTRPNEPMRARTQCRVLVALANARRRCATRHCTCCYTSVPVSPGSVPLLWRTSGARIVKAWNLGLRLRSPRLPPAGPRQPVFRASGAGASLVSRRIPRPARGSFGSAV